ncbi:hypothetical protein PUN28_008847 [Cardiocondyla obscurior]|uniref:Large ribosomal subunit protein mL45 n=1 Tax=Cardiocondyla obscurior TaxID=286306 RepID=A0AAW2FUQ7_9HYME
MLFRCVNPVLTRGKFLQNNLPVLIGAFNCPNNSIQVEQIRQITKHWDPKWKKERRQKVIKIKLPTFDEKDDDPTEMSKEEIRSRMKEQGLLPQKPWQERPTFITSTTSVFESYIPPEGDGKYSAISKEGAKQKISFLDKKRKSLMAIRKIKSFDDLFKTSFFLEEALDIYQKAHIALTSKNEDEIIKYVTEHAFPKMTHNIMNKTIHWKFLESLEPARLVHARTTDVLTKENIFAQLTVRFHTQQVLAIYDRFGRLIQGSEILRKDVLEYIVFEKHLANEYGVWRVHDKIIPSWMAPTEIAEGTYVIPKEEHVPEPTEPHSVEATLTENTPKEVTSTQSS